MAIALAAVEGAATAASPGTLARQAARGKGMLGGGRQAQRYPTPQNRRILPQNLRVCGATAESEQPLWRNRRSEQPLRPGAAREA